jgi:hypothetical protein
MDPNQTMKDIVDKLQRITLNDDNEDVSALIEEVRTSLDDLDEWVKKGGYTPDRVLMYKFT